LWKTYQGSLFGGWEMFSGTWPQQGMMRNGAVFPLRPWVPLISGSASSLWPTPRARDWKDTPGMATTATNPDGSIRDRTDQLARAVYHRETDSTATTGRLNPTWVEWLMGFPLGWTDLED